MSGALAGSPVKHAGMENGGWVNQRDLNGNRSLIHRMQHPSR